MVAVNCRTLNPVQFGYLLKECTSGLTPSHRMYFLQIIYCCLFLKNEVPERDKPSQTAPRNPYPSQHRNTNSIHC